MRCLRSALLLLLLAVSASSAAWWGGAPYTPGYPGSGYWPGAWPSYAPGYYGSPYGYNPYGYNSGYGGSDWNVKGYMTEGGDTHFVIEYRGNIYDDMTGGAYGYPGRFPGYGGYGQPYSGFPGYGRWR